MKVINIIFQLSKEDKHFSIKPLVKAGFGITLSWIHLHSYFHIFVLNGSFFLDAYRENARCFVVLVDALQNVQNVYNSALNLTWQQLIII